MWWIELIKVLPGLIAAALAVGVVVAYRKELRALLARMTRFKGLGIEAEFDPRARQVLDSAVAAAEVRIAGRAGAGLGRSQQQRTQWISEDDRKGALKRLAVVGPLLRDARILWIDDNPGTTRNERALLEGHGARVTIVTTSAEAERELRNHVYLLIITDLNREGRQTEGLEFIDRIAGTPLYRWPIAYVGTDQRGKARPAHLFAITNRPDHLLQYICDVVERERL